jgi:hypothetical protein
MTKIVSTITESNLEIAEKTLVMIMFTLAIVLLTGVTTRFTTSITLQAVANTKFTIAIKTYIHAVTKIVTTTAPIKSELILNTPAAATRMHAITTFAPKVVTFALGTPKILLWTVSLMSEDSF